MFLVKTLTPTSQTERFAIKSNSKTLDSAEAETLEAALTCLKTLVEDAGTTPVSGFSITMPPGTRIINGQPLYSADWL